MNIVSAIAEGVNILKSKHIQTAKLDTEILMTKAIGEDRKYIILNDNKMVVITDNENIDDYDEEIWFDSVKYKIKFPDKIYKVT